MACRYYDDLIIAKLKKWVPESSHLRVLKPDETKRLFETMADDKQDQALKLPFIALSRNADVRLGTNIKNPKSYDGLTIAQNEDTTAQFNVIPIEMTYQLDIYTKTAVEGDEYLRNFLFKLINNPLLKITISYNGIEISHTANIRVLDTVSDTSAISERLFSGQFTRWTIQMELQDAFLFSIPYRDNYKLYVDDSDFIEGPSETELKPELEVSEKINESGEIEPLI